MEKISAALLAAHLEYNEYRLELSDTNEKIAKDSGLVVVFGYSDDCMEFRGAIHDEVSVYDGGEAFVTLSGLLINECDSELCPYHEDAKRTAHKIKAIWDKDGFSWVYETDIPHETFVIMEEGEKYCRGIVFYLVQVSND